MPSHGSAGGASPQAKALARSLSTFGFDLLLRQAEVSTGNVTISPVSIAGVLSMIRTGAVGETEKELAQALGVEALDPTEVNQGWADLITSAQSGKKTSVTVWNSLWLREDIPFEPAFLDLNREYYAAECLPLSNDDGVAVQKINQWASERTAGKLPPLFQGLDQGTYIVVVNTVNLKVGWELFDEEDTKPESFRTAAGTHVDVPMMHGTLTTETAEKNVINDREDYEAVRLETDGPVDVWVVVPKGEGTPEDVVRTLAAGGGVSDLYLSARSWGDVEVALPRLEIMYQPSDESLKADLQSMGIKRLFDRDSAELQGIADVRKPFYVSRIAHTARIKVDEKGVEAQAASGAQVGCTGLPSEIRADRPFLVVLAESGSQAPLFLAIVRDPRVTED
ncbi:MAG: serpin family protein [Thermoleophilia bacterium]